MSLIRMDFFSQALNMHTAANIILPLPKAGPAEDIPVLWLLHGMGDDQSSWIRKSALERYALSAGLAVVIPDGCLSTYCNMVHGQRYKDYIADELPRIMAACFPLSDQREKNFIAGCSMGGYGALKIGLAHPERYAAVGCFSAANIEYRPASRFVQQTLRRNYGDEDGVDRCDEEMEANARAAAAGEYSLRLWHGWGTEDRLRPNAEISRTFFESIASPALEYHWELLPGGHDWALWDGMIEKFIAWLDLPAPKEALF